MPNNTLHRTTRTAWIVWIAMMLFSGIFISRPIIGLFIGLGFWLLFTSVVYPVFYGIIEHGSGRRSDYFDQEPEGYRTEDSPVRWVVDLQKERRRLSYLASEHFWQENPVVSLPHVVVAMVISLLLLLSLNLLGSTLIGAGVLLCTIFVTAATVFIWFVDVAVWQHHDEHRISPVISAEDIAESIEQNGVNETLEKAYPWDR